jgi:hypothetical protein
MNDEIVIPDVIGAIHGWRIWIVQQGRLFSVWNRSDVWPLREEMVASCQRSHEVPKLKCTCGIYAYRTRAHLNRIAEDYDFARGLTNAEAERYYVFGEVALWGNVVPAKHGWRCQYAYPQRLYLPYMAVNQAATLKDNYGVRIKLDDLTKHNPRRGWR